MNSAVSNAGFLLVLFAIWAESKQAIRDTPIVQRFSQPVPESEAAYLSCIILGVEQTLGKKDDI